jgi:hypothetical protein
MTLLALDHKLEPNVALSVFIEASLEICNDQRG